MLFIIDMQNNYLNPKAKGTYIKGSQKLVPGIIKKIKQYEERGEKIFYTLDIYTKKIDKINHSLENIEKKVKVADTKEKWGSSLFEPLKPYLLDHECLKKSYYAFSPDGLLGIQDKFKDNTRKIKEIEFVGVETHICVLANAICIQSAFPDAQIIIDSNLCMSSNIENHKLAIKIMEKLGMKIRR